MKCLHQDYHKTLKEAENRLDNLVKKGVKYIIANRKGLSTGPVGRGLPTHDGFFKQNYNKDMMTYTFELGMQSASYLVILQGYPCKGREIIEDIEIRYKTGNYPECKTAKYRKILSYMRCKDEGSTTYKLHNNDLRMSEIYNEPTIYGCFLSLVDILHFAIEKNDWRSI